MRLSKLPHAVIGGFLACTLVAVAGGVETGGGAWTSLTELEARGKQVYTSATSPSGGEITAYIPASSMEVPGEAMPCVNCHGADGRGRPESDVVPTDITWKELTKPYSIQLPGGRERPPYDEGALRTAIVRGMDPAGKRLAPTMPMYRMPEGDLDALVAYLKRMGAEPDPGVTDSALRLGTILPREGRFGGMGLAMESMLKACLTEVNRQGGIYNRRLELEVVELGDSPEAALGNLRRWLEGGDVFALVAPFIVGVDRKLARWAGSIDLPVVGPFTLFPLPAESMNHSVFYLFSGLGDQARAFLDFASGGTGIAVGGLTLAAPEDELPAEDIEAVVGHARRRGIQPLEVLRYPAGGLPYELKVREWQGKGVTLVLFYGSREELATLLEEGAARGWRPSVFLSGSQVTQEVFQLAAAHPNPLYLSYPMLPLDQTPAGSREIGRLMEAHGLRPVHFHAQLTAYCAVKILLEGLKSAGREVTRQGLINHLEKLYEFETGLTPRLTYGPNRRIGAWGAHIVRVDPHRKELTPVSGWITPSGR